MTRIPIRRIKHLALIAGILLCLLVSVQVALGSNIDATEKCAWSKNVGWINFDPHGEEGVTVYTDHLEGYAWAENVGWIRLGSHEGGGAHTYANDASDTYGVNNDGSGNLSGYAWSKNVGWINFAPDEGGVTIDPHTGSFDGFAWGENIGWISFKGAGTHPYNVLTDWRQVVVVGGFTEPWDLLASSWLLVLLVALVAAGSVAALALRRHRT